MKTAFIQILALWAVGLGGCASDYPPIPVGDVSGTVFYEGAALATTPNPVLVVGAFAYDPSFLDRITAGEKPVPHAVFFAPNPVFTPAGISYRLSNLEPYAKGYFVTAVILDVMDAAAKPTASGLFPDMGILTSKPEVGPVEVVRGFMRTQVDIRIADVAAP